MHVIKDAIHGNIKLTELERSLVDTREMQRLRGIKQLALTYLVYPGANHTRFEHSLGTLHLTGEICESLALGEGATRELRIAALLHDVGHGAFSHESDYFLEKHLGETHESLAAKKLGSNSIAQLLGREGIKPSRIASLISGKELGSIITSGIGSDRMDYLLRDSYYTGVAYGVIDSERLIHTMFLDEGEIALDEGGLEAAESLLLARFMMFSTVYSHHAVRIASAMLRRAIERGLESGAIRAADLLSFDDSGLMRALLADERAGRFVRAVENRGLYKRALVYEWGRISQKTRGIIQKGGQGRELAEGIASLAGLGRDDVLVSLPVESSKDLANLPILVSGERATLAKRRVALSKFPKTASSTLFEASELVKSIRFAEDKRKRIIVACPPYAVNRVEKAARKGLGV